MDSLLKIKEFSKLANVSVRTLQYYDDINLLKPAYVNDFGHRFYNQNLFEELFIINTLKSIGFKLENIKDFISNQDFDLEDFIQREKAKTLSDIGKLQGKYMALNSIDFYKGKPYIENVSSHLKVNTPVNESEGNDLFLEWNTFIERLNDAVEIEPLIKNELTQNIYDFWFNNVLKHSKDNQISVAETERYYFKMKEQMNTYGLNQDNYITLKKIISLFEK